MEAIALLCVAAIPLIAVFFLCIRYRRFGAALALLGLLAYSVLAAAEKLFGSLLSDPSSILNSPDVKFFLGSFPHIDLSTGKTIALALAAAGAVVAVCEHLFRAGRNGRG